MPYFDGERGIYANWHEELDINSNVWWWRQQENNALTLLLVSNISYLFDWTSKVERARLNGYRLKILRLSSQLLWSFLNLEFEIERNDDKILDFFCPWHKLRAGELSIDWDLWPSVVTCWEHPPLCLMTTKWSNTTSQNIIHKRNPPSNLKNQTKFSGY